MFNEGLDYLCALYDPLPAKGSVIIIGDLNGDSGNSLGGRGKYRVSQKICQNPAHTNPFFWIHLLDV